MKQKIPKCEHGNEYEFVGYSLILSNESNRIYLSKQDFRELVDLAEKGFP